jgi:hypothetical protein
MSERKLTIGFSTQSDLSITTSTDEIRSRLDQEKPVLHLVANPFLRALSQGIDLNEENRNDPKAGEGLTARLKAEVQSEIESALSEGADGIFYLLEGARGAYSTPMEYGGYHLETDRNLLESIHDANLNAVYVLGHEDLYIDFVSDLPAHLFAWDAESSTFNDEYVRTLRKGALASNDPNSEVFFDTNPVQLEQLIKQLMSDGAPNLLTSAAK